ncbi:GIY-YIG nuclease family protein [Saccharopolyspora erythraea]|uniref:GIY-YIG nuclease family protein n=1 Tax=Saccharopolyspora erythraea TaxID=1836 RepID=UPI001BA6690D|nr:GIY-YIG nuclease family protein [Saccharopolyspora erythraea]QUH01417.1 GIY-YIG nuclease family protein [Saccharopolyspora erythraea]
MISITDEKVCRRCNTGKPLAEFHRKNASPDGRQDWCKPCQKEAVYSGRDSLPVDGPAGYVYLVQFSTGRTKVGRATHPEHRISQHAYNAECMGLSVARTWISPVVADPASLETAAIRIVADLSTSTVKREWFDGVDFDSAVEQISSLEEK